MILPAKKKKATPSEAKNGLRLQNNLIQDARVILASTFPKVFVTMEASGSCERTSLEMDERPSKRPCLQAPCGETSEFPFTPVEDGSDFYDTPLPTNTLARAEEPRILTDAAPPSTPTIAASIPGLGMLADSAMLAQEDRLEAPNGAQDEAADTVEAEVGDAAGSILATPIAEHIELSEPAQNEPDSHHPPSRAQADDLNTRDEVGTKDTIIDGFPRIQDTGVNDGVTEDTTQDHLLETRDTQVHGESFGTSLEPFKNPCGVQSCNIQNRDSGMADIGDELAARESTITPKVSEGESATCATMFPTLDSTKGHQILPDLPPTVESTDGRQILPNLIPNSENPEWEADSSPYQSSSSSVSSDFSSDSSSEDEDEYQLLTPSEQVRILMQEERGSDDEDHGDSSKVKDPMSGPSRIRTANEKPDTIIPIPDITLSQESKITPLGVVEGEVENTLLVRASVAGDYQVLESGSVLCLSDRSIIGVVSETLGRVQQPLYTVRFSNTEAIRERGVAESGTEIFYVDAHSTFAFTQALKAIKGSDASNIHDEEVGDHEIEFSDDEKEAEYKRQLKLKKRDRRGGDDGLARPRGGFRQNGHGYPDRGMEVHYDDGGSMVSYDDGVGNATNGDDVYDEGYTPLARPSNLHEMMGNKEPPQESWAPNGNQRPSSQIYADTGRGRGHPRGGMRGRRGRDGQQRGRGRERRGFDNRRNTNNYVDQRPSYAHDPASRSSNITHHSSPHSGQHSYEPTQAHLSSSTAVPSLPSPNSSYQTPAHMFHPYQLSSPQQRPTPVTALPSSQSPQIHPSQGHIHAHISSQSQTQPYPSSGSPLAHMGLYPPRSHVNPAFFAGFQQQQRQGYEPYTQSAQPSYSPSSRLEGHGQQDGQAQGNSQEMGAGSIGGAAGGFGGTIPDILRRFGSGSPP